MAKASGISVALVSRGPEEVQFEFITILRISCSLDFLFPFLLFFIFNFY